MAKKTPARRKHPKMVRGRKAKIVRKVMKRKAHKIMIKKAKKVVHKKLVHKGKAAKRAVMPIRRPMPKGAKALIEKRPKTEIVRRKKGEMFLKNLPIETVEAIKKDTVFTEFVNANLGKRTDEIILSLATPITDEGLAEKLGMKINDTRRVLNMLNSDGVARYIVNKNSKGWLTFKWYLDEENLNKYRKSVVLKTASNVSALPENCNDFYVCSKCYSKKKLVYPFEVGYEMNFRCKDCGSIFERKSKEEIESLFF